MPPIQLTAHIGGPWIWRRSRSGTSNASAHFSRLFHSWSTSACHGSASKFKAPSQISDPSRASQPPKSRTFPSIRSVVILRPEIRTRRAQAPYHISEETSLSQWMKKGSFTRKNATSGYESGCLVPLRLSSSALQAVGARLPKIEPTTCGTVPRSWRAETGEYSIVPGEEYCEYPRDNRFNGHSRRSCAIDTRNFNTPGIC